MDEAAARPEQPVQVWALAPILFPDDAWRGAKAEMMDFLSQPGARVDHAVAWLKERRTITKDLIKRANECRN